MKSLLCAIVIAVVVVAMFQAPTPAAAQTLKAKPDLKGPTPRLPNGKPDFSGVWARPGAQDLTRTFTNRDGTSNKGEPNPLPFTPWGQAQWDNYNPVKNGDYAGSCMPFGWVRSFTPHPMQILQNNEYISFLFEQSTMFQAVNTEGLPHRKDWPPTWFGDSRGHWDGDTLVIDSVGFNDISWLGWEGYFHSDKMEVTERFLRQGDLLYYNFTVNDPEVLLEPWTSYTYVRRVNPNPNRQDEATECDERNLKLLADPFLRG